VARLQIYKIKIRSLALNIPNVLVRNFPPSDDQSICLDTVQEHFSLLCDIMGIVWHAFYGVCYFTIIYTCVYAFATVKNVNISNKRKSSKLKTKYRMSIIKHVLLIVCFVVLEGSSFICGGFIELNILEPGSINQYFSLLSVVCFVICILLSIHIRDNDRRVLNVNCQCICNNIYFCISFVSGLTVSKLLSVQLNCLSRKSQQQNLGFSFFFIKSSMLNCNDRIQFVL
jgi:hypothetical protein